MVCFWNQLRQCGLFSENASGSHLIVIFSICIKWSIIFSGLAYLAASHNSRDLACHLAPSGDVCVLSLNKHISVSCDLGLPDWFQKYLSGSLCLFHRLNMGYLTGRTLGTQGPTLHCLLPESGFPCKALSISHSHSKNIRTLVCSLWQRKAECTPEINSSISKFTLSWEFYCIYSLEFFSDCTNRLEKE